MFIGHFGAGFAAKPTAPKCSLGTLFMAAQFIDLLWPLFILLGIEKVVIDPGNTAFTPLDFVYYPFTHSFVGVLFWAVLFGTIYYALRKNLQTSVLLGGIVLSHWIMDFLVHRPDLPLVPGMEHKVGMGLWNSIPFTLLIEGLIFLAGVIFYMTRTKGIDRSGRYGTLGLIIFLIAIYVMNVLGPIPESTESIGIAGMFQWLIVFWAYWVDRHRIYKSQKESHDSSPVLVGKRT